MVTPSRELPFKVTFHRYEVETPIVDFNLEDEEEAMRVAKKVVEYHPFAITFQANDPNARLYMDGLELLPNTIVQTDEQRIPFLHPDNSKVWIYRGSNTEDYPLIPGYYSLRVVIGEEIYSTLYFVEPKDLSFAEWELMRGEIEDVMKGLAGDFVRKRLSLGMDTKNFLPPELYTRYTIIEKHYPKLMLAIHDLMTKVNYRVRKDYRLLPISRSKDMDEKTVRYRLQHPDQEDVLMTPVREVDYDLPENQWVIRILNIVDKYLEEIIDSLNALHQYELSSVRRDRDNNPVGALNRERENNGNYLLTLLSNARKYKNSLQIIKSSSWYDSVSENVKFTQFPPAMLYDPRYRSFYQLYRELRSENKTIDITNEYTYQWKRTDLLYEIWGFLKVSQALIDLGFEPKRGWIYDAIPSTKFFIPVLKAGTVIHFEKENIEIDLVYDQMIKRTAFETQDDLLTIYTDYHNRPDARLDIFVDEQYHGSVVMDFKYRKLKKFWDIQNPHFTATNQLLHYHTNITSRHIPGGDLIKTVPEVWAIYPEEETQNSGAMDFDHQHKVRFVKLRPGKNHDHLSVTLENAITHTIERLSNLLKQLSQFSRS